jgi:hypothetical protein
MPCSQVLQIIVFLFDEYVFIEDDSRLSDEPMGAHSQSLCGVSLSIHCLGPDPSLLAVSYTESS